MAFFKRWYNNEEAWNEGLRVAQTELDELAKADPRTLLRPDLTPAEFMERYPAEILNWERDTVSQAGCHQSGVLAAVALGIFGGMGGHLLMKQVPDVTRIARVAGGIAMGSLGFLWVARYKGQKCLREAINNPDSRQSQLVRRKLYEFNPQHRALATFRAEHPSQARREDIFDLPELQQLESQEQQPEGERQVTSPPKEE